MSTAGGHHPTMPHRHDRRRYDLLASGFVYLATALFLAIGALNSQNNLLFWAFGLAVAGLIVSGIVSGVPLMHLELEREPPPPAHVGEQITLRYRLFHRGRLWPLFGLRICEIAENQDQSALIFSPDGIAHIGPHDCVRATAPALPRMRGVHSICTVCVSTTFPLGLVRRSLYFDLPARIIVRPAVAPLRKEIASRIVPGREDSTRSLARVGHGGDFFGLRDYAPGDPVRTIAWKPSARRDTLLVRQQTTPAPPRLWLRLEQPPADISEQQFENAVALLASIIVHASRKGLAPGLVIEWADVSLPPALSPAHAERLLDTLARLERRDKAHKSRARTRADLVVSFTPSHEPGVISDLDPAHWAAEHIVTVLPKADRPRRTRGRT